MRKRIHSVAITHRVRILNRFGLGLITGYPSPLHSNSVTTLLLINYVLRTSFLLEYAVEQRPNLNPSSNPASTPGTISRIRPLGDRTLVSDMWG